MSIKNYTMSAKWIHFIEQEPNKKTRRWWVGSKDSIKIGDVKWYGPWRKYAFFPEPITVFEEDCLRDLAEFCETRTKEHRANRKKHET